MSAFMEAVEILAGEAGMPMPARDPKAAQKADRRSQLIEVMEQAVQFYPHATEDRFGGARAGLSGAVAACRLTAQDRWEIGYRARGVAEPVGPSDGQGRCAGTDSLLPVLCQAIRSRQKTL